MKLEGVVLAAGSGSRMVELTRGRPKCLLPVGNQPLLWFAITGLRSIGIDRIILLIPDTHENDIKQYCNRKFSSQKDLTLEFVVVAAKSDSGSAASILNIREKIKGDFVVYSCDTIVSNKALSHMANHYRLYDPMLTMLLSDNPKYFESRSGPGRREKVRSTRDIIALEPLDRLDLTAGESYSANKVIFLHSERDLKKNLKIKNRELALHPSLEVHSRLLDAHVYIFKQEVFKFMAKNAYKTVLKAEMIPSLVTSQTSRMRPKSISDDLEEGEGSMDSKSHRIDYELELREVLEIFKPRTAIRSTCFQRTSIPEPTACHALVIKDILATRANTLSTYLDCNIDAKQILNLFNPGGLNLIKDCVVGENTKVGQKCLIKRGSIGSNCKIGDKVKLIDCVIMDNVEIEANSSLNECIVGLGARIGSKCDLKSCVVGARQSVGSDKKATGEVILDDVYVIDLSDPIIDTSE